MNIVDELLLKIAIERVCESLHLGRRRKHNIAEFSDCPTGHPTVGDFSFGIVPYKNYFFCLGCGIGGNIIDLVCLVQKTTPESAIKWLVETFRPDLSHKLATAPVSYTPRTGRYYQQAFFYELIFNEGKRLLYESDTGRRLLSRLTGTKGYAPDVLKETEWIFFPQEGEIRRSLVHEFPEARAFIFGTPKKKYEDQIPLHGEYGDNYRLAFPYRDRHTLITGFIKHSVAREVREKWDMTHGIIRDDLFNLWRSRGKEKVILINDYAETMYLSALDSPDYAFVGIGPEIPKAQSFAQLADSGFKKVIVFPDNPINHTDLENQIDRTLKILQIIEKQKLETFVIDPGFLDRYQTPGEFLLGNRFQRLPGKGVEETFNLINAHLASASIWIAQRMIREWKLAPSTEKDAILRKILAFRMNIHDFLEQSEFEKAVKIGLNLSDAAYEKIVADFNLESQKIKLKNAFIEVLNRGIGSNGDYQAVQQTVKELNELLGFYYRDFSAPGMRLSEVIRNQFLAQKNQDIISKKIPTFNYFKSLNKYTPSSTGGLVLLLAPGSEVRTLFTANLALDPIANSLTTGCMFVSILEPKHRILQHMVRAYPTVKIDEQNFRLFESEDFVDERAFRFFIDAAEANRFNLIDFTDFRTFSDLENLLTNQGNNYHILVLDSLHFLETDSNGAHSARLRSNVAFLRRIAYTFQIPVIVSMDQNRDLTRELLPLADSVFILNSSADDQTDQIMHLELKISKFPTGFTSRKQIEILQFNLDTLTGEISEQVESAPPIIAPTLDFSGSSEDNLSDLIPIASLTDTDSKLTDTGTFLLDTSVLPMGTVETVSNDKKKHPKKKHRKNLKSNRKKGMIRKKFR